MRLRSGTTNVYTCASRAPASLSAANSISTRLATVPLVSPIEVQPHNLRDRRAQCLPDRPRPLAQAGGQRRREPDREHCRALRHRDPSQRRLRRVHVPARLTLRKNRSRPAARAPPPPATGRPATRPRGSPARRTPRHELDGAPSAIPLLHLTAESSSPAAESTARTRSLRLRGSSQRVGAGEPDL
jgi:hypothetical protein